MEIYSRVREAVTCPVTMKLRTGFDNSRESYDNFFHIISEASRLNVDALTIHGRTVLQRFTGDVDWDLLAEIKNSFPNTTIIGSGDLFEPQTIIARLRAAKLDGIIIARGAIGNPWIYRGLAAVLASRPAPNHPALSEQAEVIQKHFEMLCQIFGQAKAIRYFRKFLIHYCRLHPRRKQAQQSLLAAKNRKQLLVAIEKWYSDNYSIIENDQLHCL